MGIFRYGIILLLGAGSLISALEIFAGGDPEVDDVPTPACVFEWAAPIVRESFDGSAQDVEPYFHSRTIPGIDTGDFGFITTETMYSIGRPLVFIIAIEDGSNCSVIWGPTRKLLGINAGFDIEFSLAVERFNEFVSKASVTPLAWGDAKLVKYASVAVVLASTPWVHNRPKLVVVEALSDIPGVSAASVDEVSLDRILGVEIQPSSLERSDRAALVQLHTWSEFGGMLERREVLIRKNGTVAIASTTIAKGFGDHVKVIRNF